MLSLHTTFRKLLFAIFPLFIILISCSDRSKNDLSVIEALNESIENSNRVVNASTTEIMISLEKKLNDYSSKERAMVWLPVAQTVQRVSKKAIDQIQEIKAKLEKDQKSNISDEEILNVYDRVLNYKSELLQIDSKLARDYNRYLKIFTRSIDSSKENQIELFKEYFSTTSRTGAIAMLTKLQNNIKINEEGMITYCHEYSTPIICGVQYLTSPIIIQNSTIVRPGEEIIITAGLGAFDPFMMPKIFIHNKLIQLDDDRAARYTGKAPSIPGMYYVPVKINYTDQEGKQQSVQKEVEYTVANVPKQ
jgi:hypothetical protein